eukprot:1159570-Pelagomonas_calceolata.AAC.7
MKKERSMRIRRGTGRTMGLDHQCAIKPVWGGEEDALYRWESTGGSFLNARGRTASGFQGKKASLRPFGSQGWHSRPVTASLFIHAHEIIKEKRKCVVILPSNSKSVNPQPASGSVAKNVTGKIQVHEVCTIDDMSAVYSGIRGWSQAIIGSLIRSECARPSSADKRCDA